jgi:hypothetical protein
MEFKEEGREKMKRKKRGSWSQTITITTISVISLGRGRRDASNIIVEFGVTSPQGDLHAARIERSHSTHWCGYLFL